MKVEIWSDIVCPFCYIGKRSFEAALKDFSHLDEIEVEYKSFQLNPNTITDPDTSTYQNLANHKNISLDHAKQMSDQVVQMAREVGLVYDFDKAVVANTFRAHQLLHLAKEYSKQTEAKELLLRSYFTEGKNIDDLDTLVALGEELGIDKTATQEALENKTYAPAVKNDILEAQQLRIHAVPFFVFNRKYGVSGAQPVEAFQQTLQKSFVEWKEKSMSV